MDFNVIMTYFGYVFLGILLILGTIHFLRILFFSRLSTESNKVEKSVKEYTEVEVKDKKVIAAVTAAIQCFYDAEQKAVASSNVTQSVPPSGFIVRSIKKRI